MLIWFIFALLILIPLVLHLRGGGVVALATSVTILYPIAILVGWLVLGETAADPSTPTQTTTPIEAPISDTFAVVPNIMFLGSIIALFATIALCFWALSRWDAPLPADRLKTLFWLLHISILALPFAMYVFIYFGIFAAYLGSEDTLPVFAMSSVLISVLCLIAVAGFAFTALGAVIKRVRH